MYNNYDNVKAQINAVPPETLLQYGFVQLANDNKTYNCIFCTNGTGKHGHGLTPNSVNGAYLWHCFSCDEGYDNITIVAKYYGLDLSADFAEICDKACEAFHITPDFNFKPKSKQPTQEELELKRLEYSAICIDIETAPKFLSRLPESQRRGLTLDTLRKYHCGYLEEWVSPKIRAKDRLFPNNRPAGSLPLRTPRFIIPAGNHYLARLTVPLETFDTHKREYIQEKPHAGTKYPFGTDFINENTATVVIVEGEIDAMSISQAVNEDVIVPVATLGTTTSDEVKQALIAKFDNTDANILILFDNDDAGKKAAPKLCNYLIEAGYPAVVDFLSDSDEKVDANDILRNQGADVLANLIRAKIDAAQERFNAVRIQLALNAELKDKLAEFETRKGKIEPKTLEDLKAAVDYIKSLTVDNLNSVNATNSKTVDALALCTFYDFYQSVVDDFLSRVTAARNLAKAQVKAATDDNPADISVQNMARVGLSEIKDAISKEVTVVKSKHADYNKRHEQEQARVEWQRKQKQAQNKLQRSIEKLNGLIKQPQTPERDNNIVNLILDNCDWRLGKYGEKISVKPTQANYDLIFTYDPVLSGLIGYDEFKAAVVFLRKPIWNKSVEIFDTWTDSDDSNARIYLRRTYKDISGDNIFLDNLISYATKNRFNAVKEYFEKLPKWDGTKRAETLFIDFLKIEDTPFARAVTIKWLLAAVSRIFHPACTFQAALVLRGNQHIGKSYILERLGGKWFGSLVDNVDDTHAVDAIKKLWIVELKEMAAARKSEINATKAFLERSTDTHRAAFARNAETFKRHCVFAITVNDKQFLRDMTGNRRYWILESPLEEFECQEGLTDDVVQQVWAEVYAMFKSLTVNGFNDKILELPLEFKQQAEIIAKRFTADDGLQSEIAAFLEIPIPKPIIWNLLTPAEKRKYFEHNKLELEDGELCKRSKILKDEALEEFDAEYEKIDRREVPTGKDSAPNLVDVLRGRYYRQETCASEIYHEYFYGVDKRRQIYKIIEALDKMGNWLLVDDYRIRNFNGYGDQKKIYRRTNGEKTTDTVEVENLPADLPF